MMKQRREFRRSLEGFEDSFLQLKKSFELHVIENTNLGTSIPKISDGSDLVFPSNAWPFLGDLFIRMASEEGISRVLLFPSEREAEELVATLREISSARSILYLPSWGSFPYAYSRPDVNREGERARSLAILKKLSESDAGFLIVTTLDSLRARILHPNETSGSTLLIEPFSLISPQKIIEFLAFGGYENSSIVEKPGEWSQKGDLIDVFLPGRMDPVRIDFFDNQIESIRSFDPLTQRSISSLEYLTLYPRRDLLISKSRRNLLIQKTYKKFDKISSKTILPPFFEREEIYDGIWDMFPLEFKTSTIFDLIEKIPIILWDPSRFQARLESAREETEFLYRKYDEHLRLDQEELFLSPKEFNERLSAMQICNALPITRNVNDIYLNLYEPPKFKGRISKLIETLEKDYNKKKIYVSLSDKAQKERFEHIISAYPEIVNKIKSFESPLKRGLEFGEILLLSEYEVFGKSIRRTKISKTTSQVIESFVDLKERDFIVHIHYGIGRFLGLKRMKIAGTQKDFLDIEFAGSDKLYVPLEQLSLVHRYIGSQENTRLDFLGKKSSWEKTKKRVQESIEKLAESLLTLYAKREKLRGFAFPADSQFQEEFEASFSYEETDHQISAINDVKKDMESTKPMDRLICGDVGFGKTEVAIRATFKAVMAGRQIALLCPTTILAFQHYHTFRSRFQNYPIQVDYVSRFRSAKEISEVKDRLKSGKIDVLIGTHAILSKQYQIKNLGLLIIDEEQRFGVSHKESIKEIKSHIDCLTMTATPIPRTLHMSLVGIRDLSLIETPPRNRQKIETFVLEENDEILRQALLKEIKRHGQAYVLHNKVKTIDAQAQRIGKILPEARIGVLHGQMDEEIIEMRMLDFYKNSYDVLVATSIIESGIDIPNVNTLIVMNAHEFGLSQLYQIKGRVGRSDRKAMAYFFYPSHQVITELAQKRLNTLQEYDELGAGFKIAMKDLEIRGAGSLLGSEQSGDILDVGFELYVQMLQEKIAELKEEEITSFTTTVVVDIDFYFEDDYIPDTRQKMEFYKKLASIQTDEGFESLEKELQDRFGPLSENSKAMISQERLRVLGSAIRLEKIEFFNGLFTIYASPQTLIEMEKLTRLIKNDNRFTLDPQNPLAILFKPKNKKIQLALGEVASVLSYLLP